jgi:predicted phage terminase large subunit-like protein
MVWLQLRNPDDRILYVMAAASEARKTLGVTRRCFQNEMVSHFFPDRVLNPRIHPNTQDYFTLPRENDYREHSVEVRGVDSTMTGGHFTVQILDDLIDEKMKYSEIVQDKVIDFFKEATSLFVDQKNDLRLVIGTVWEGEFYDWILDSGALDGYEKLIIGCRVDQRYRNFMAEIGQEVKQEDGEPIWPDQFDNETLEEIERIQGSVHFGRQWLNIRLMDEDVRFREEDFQKMSIDAEGKYVIEIDNIQESTGQPKKIPISELYRSVVIDLGTGEHQKTDDSAITVCGYDYHTGNIYVLDTWALKAQPHRVIEQIIIMARAWKPHVIGPEEVGYQSVLKRFLMPEMMKRGVVYPVRPVKPQQRNKITRIDGLQPFVRNHQLFVQPSAKPLVREMCNLQVVRGKIIGKSPNLADSLAYHLDFWNMRDFQTDNKDEDEIPYRDAQRRDPVRAYGLEVTG